MTEALEQVPQYSVVLLDDGIQEKLQVVVRLPGITSTQEFVVTVQSGALFLHSPGRYLLDLPLDPIVDEKPEQLKFVKKRSELRSAPPPAKPATAAEPMPVPRPARPSLHESFLADAAKLRDSKARPRPASGAKTAKVAKAETGPSAERALPEGQQPAAQAAHSEWERPRRRTRKQVRDAPALHSSAAANGFDGYGFEGEEERQEAEASGAQETAAGAGKPEGSQGPSAAKGWQGPETPSPTASSSEHWRAAAAEGAPPTPEFSFRAMPNGSAATSDAPHEAGGAFVSEVQGEGDDEDSKYEAARWRANVEAGRDCMHKASDALSAGEYERALRLATKASRLSVEGDPLCRQDIHHFMQKVSRFMTEAQRAKFEAWRAEERGSMHAAAGADGTPGSAFEAGTPPQTGSSNAESGSSTATAGAGAPPDATPETGGGGRARGGDPSGGKPTSTAKQQQQQQKRSKQQEPAPSSQPRPRSESPPTPAASEPSSPAADSGSQEGQAAETEEWYRTYLKQGGWRKYAALAYLCLATCVLAVYFMGRQAASAVVRSAPDLLLSIAAALRWTKIHRSLTVRRRRSPAFRTALTAASYLTLLLLAYAGFKTVVLGFRLAAWSLWLGWEAAGALLSALLFMLDLAFWTPRLFSSLLLSGLMLTGPAIFGPRSRGAYYLSCLWSWPLLAHCLRGGVAGICALPHCFVATIWWRSHLEILAAFYVTRFGAAWLHWGYDRPLALVFGAVYLFLRGSAFFETKGRAGASQASAVEVPEGAEGEVARVLQSEDFYEVLGVPQNADAETLKRAKRQKSLSTHPDKLHQAPGSNEAFARVTEAHDVLSDPRKKAEYDSQLRLKAMLAAHEEASGRGGFGSNPPSPMGTATFGLACPRCGQDHEGVLTDRPASRARYCRQCRQFHGAEEYDGWLETSGWLFTRTAKMYLCLGGEVYDITAWASCSINLADVAGSSVCDTHEPGFNFGGGEQSRFRTAGVNRKKARNRRRK